MIQLAAVRWGRVALVLGAAIAVAAVLFGTYQAGRSDGAMAAENKLLQAQLQAAEKRAADAERIASLERELRLQGEQTTLLLAQAQQRTDRAIVTLKEALRANADYAATRRPDDVHRVRVEQLRAVAAAATAAILPGAGDAGLRTTGGTDGPDDGRDGTGGRGEPAPLGGLRDPP